MYSPVQLGFKYLRYYITASNGKGHGVHSPFVFSFITQVLNDQRQFYAYSQLEALRKDLLSDHREITLEDFGAGSRIKKDNVRKLSSIAATSLKPAKFSQLLFRIADHFKPSVILELGTSLGITTSYLASANPAARITTMEGASAVAAVAKNNFSKLGLGNIRVVEGNFDHTLAETLTTIPLIDLAFLDGNHRYEPTVRYFRQILPHLQEHSIVILDDIHWSAEMEQAWDEVRGMEEVTLSIDLFFIGIVFFRKEQKEKQHFSIRF
ncbi:O-methyltransferase [Sediminibacterium ginsengisoli]|uniref:Methyltransferase domain-containing protein n=1 Tax=Sediminibacterium ginsengisoli TaxID=413434 RepID=A0A1T4KP42_9BACT|nr:class I SAM-dependent methyltransferase [Sediminibacterium ginsengisoli]SJZ44153.1 Methyltransferase domain-containing protein [Sediminibacterium ginsengisoli]